jgi:LPS export ABC transporter protein LptC/lipopolysaccharide transport protein LptA
MRWISRVLFFIFIAFLVVELWLGFPEIIQVLNTKNNLGQVSPEESQPIVPSSERKMSGVHLVESQSGQRDWELFATSAFGTEAKGSWKLETVKINFFNEKGMQFTVTGNRGFFDPQSKNISVEGQVLTVSTNGYEFRTDSAQYLSSEKKISSPDSVKMFGPKDKKGKRLELIGVGMETHLEQSKMKILRQVRAEKYLEEGRQLVILSGAAEFSAKSQLSRFYEQVSLKVDSVKMQGPEAQFVYSQTKQTLERVTILGGAKISDDDKFATAETVEYFPQEDRYTLQGNPRVIQNTDEIVGDKIILIDGGRKIRVEKVRAKVDQGNE